MTSNERVLATVHRQPVDRQCVDYQANADVNDAFCQHLGLSDIEAVRKAIGSDIRSLVSAAPYTGEPFPPLDDGTARDYFGVTDSQGTYSSTIYRPPLANVGSVAEVEAYPWPDAADFDYSHLREQCAGHEGYAISGGAWSPILCMGMYMAGMEEFLSLMALKPDVAEAMLTHLTDFFYEYSRRFFEECADLLTIYYMGDDYGVQAAPMISPAMFRRFVLPNLKRFYDLAHSYDLLVMMHSCGSVRAFIPDLIGIGLDILDPVQVRAAGMDVQGLKRDFGKDISFHGSIDTQQTLPRGTVADVEAEVRSRMALFADGGWICCGSQDYIRDIPLENLLAIYRTCGSATV